MVILSDVLKDYVPDQIREKGFGNISGLIPPRPFIEVKWIESNGDQYIDTGCVADSNLGLEMKLEYTETLDSTITVNAPGAISLPSTYIRHHLNISNTSGWRYYLGSGTQFYVESDRSRKISVTVDAVNRTVTVNGTTGYWGEISEFSTDITYLLPCRHTYNRTTGETNVTPFTGRVYFAKFYYNGDLVRDFIPVKFTNEQNQTEGALYDKVSGLLFRNQGTESFKVGPDVNPISARSYIQDGLVGLWDGIENAGWGTHVDELPVEYGNPQWRNLISGYSKNFDIDVNNMWATGDGLAWDTSVKANPWAGWGYSFNTSKISVNDSIAFIAGLNLATEFTAEVVGTFSGSLSPSQAIILGGYNERVVYSHYSSTVTPLIAWRTAGSGSNQYHAFGANVSGTSTSITVSQSNTNQSSKTYQNAVVNLNKPGAVNSYWFYNMVALCRLNADSTASSNKKYPPTTSGRYHCVRIYNRQLSDEEVAHNYTVDKIRFNLP